MHANDWNSWESTLARFYEPMDDDLDDYDPLDGAEEREVQSLKSADSIATGLSDFLAEVNTGAAQAGAADRPSQGTDLGLSAQANERMERSDEYEQQVTEMLREKIQVPAAADVSEARDKSELREMRIRERFKPLSTRAPALGGRKI